MRQPAPENSGIQHPRPMMQVHRLVKAFDDHRVVDRLSLALKPGEVLGLVGPAGAGKSTTLRCLAGVTRATAGSILVGGLDIALYPAEARRQMIFIPEEPRLLEHLTVWDQMILQARTRTDARSLERARSLLDEFDLGNLLDAFPRQLNRQQKQSLLLASALLQRPRVLILDVPFAGLEAAAAQRARETILRIAGEGTAVIFSSRELCPLEGFCQRVVVILGGRTVFEGTVEETRRAVPQLRTLSGLDAIFTHAPSGNA
jgi:ABC-2 type transport system ATP-binding protein